MRSTLEKQGCNFEQLGEHFVPWPSINLALTRLLIKGRAEDQRPLGTFNSLGEVFVHANYHAWVKNTMQDLQELKQEGVLEANGSGEVVREGQRKCPDRVARDQT